jgi:hypothetical protein
MRHDGNLAAVIEVPQKADRIAVLPKPVQEETHAPQQMALIASLERG